MIGIMPMRQAEMPIIERLAGALNLLEDVGSVRGPEKDLGLWLCFSMNSPMAPMSSSTFERRRVGSSCASGLARCG